MIRFTDTSKRFGETLAVDRLTLSIGEGEVVVLLGPNGSGKTTTLKMAAGLVRPDSGTVTIGEPPIAAARPEARRSLSFLPQRVAFPEALTGREVIEFYRQLRAAAPDRATSVMKFASLNGAGERAVATYSGGMLQRLGLAVAMLPGEATLLLDEPTAALDPEGLQAFYALVGNRRSEGRTVLLTSHQAADVERLADRVLIMAAGRLAGEYTREQLRAWRDAHGVMRVRVAGQVEDLRIAGSAAERAAGLEAIRSRGAIITGLTAEDGRLEGLSADLVARVGKDGTHA